MKSYSISSKSYVSINIPIDKDTTLTIPKKGKSITVTLNSIPLGLKKLADSNVITIKEIS